MWNDPRLRWSLDPPPAAPTWKWPQYTVVNRKQVAFIIIVHKELIG